jgi:hypothetical protein
MFRERFVELVENVLFLVVEDRTLVMSSIE